MIESDKWSILEAQELERFASRCTLFQKRMEDNYPYLTGKLRVEW